MKQKKQLEQLINLAQKEISKVCDDLKLDIDSANFQTNSKESFDKFSNEFEANSLKYMFELDHAGRRIKVYDASNAEIGINYTELSEPKPSSVIKDNYWEYVSFVASDYDKCLKHLQKKGLRLHKIREIADTKYFYYQTNTVLIQIRNKSVADISNKAKSESITEDTEDLVKKYEDLKQKHILLIADFENYRKIQQKQIEQRSLNEKLNIIEELIEVVEDFERAMKNENFEGIRSIYQKIVQILELNQIKEIDVKNGSIFDSSKMEALSTVPAPDENLDNKVQEVIQKGYMHIPTQRVIKMPKVIVAKYQK